MRLLSASVFLAYSDGSQLSVALPVQRPARRRTQSAPHVNPAPLQASLDHDVVALVSEFFSQPLRRIPFLTSAQSATSEAREGFFRVIDKLGETGFRRLTKVQQLILAELHDFHCECNTPIDEIDRDYYLDTNGAE
jgi:hypothetical protein